MRHANYAVIDWETRSARNLKRVGVEKYVECPHFDALCLGVEWPDNTRELWLRGQPPPAKLIEHVAAGRTAVAHNAGFELACWAEMRRRDKRWPELRAEQVVDTMILSRAMGLPGALADAAGAMRLPVRKDLEGHKLMLSMCQPRGARKGDPPGAVLWNETPEQLARLGAYCLVDVEVQHALYKLLPPLPPEEQEAWVISERINTRGVLIDVPSATRAAELITEETEKLGALFKQFTNGKVTSGNQVAKLLEWLNEQGVKVGTLKKSEVQRLLDDPEALRDKDTARTVLALRKDSAKASTAKLKAMLASACADGRARGLFAFHAANTGRWAGRRVQTQNLPRTPKNFKPDDAVSVIDWLAKPAAIRAWYGAIMDPVSWSLRSFLKARPGARFIACDFSNIEGRVLAWLAGEEWKLDAFRAFDNKAGPDLYNLAYARSFGVPVESVADDQRQIGKVQELALGYQGGVGAFTSMAANYGITVVLDRRDAPANAKHVITETEADIIKCKWREANPAIQQFWYDLSDAATEAIENPGRITNAGRIHYRVRGDFLLCRLPSGRCISYAYPSIKYMTTTWYEREVAKITAALEAAEDDLHTDEGARAYGALRDILDDLKANPDKRNQITFWGINSKSKNKRWGLCRAYGGLLAENATQAQARDCLRVAIKNLEASAYPVVLHAHDEVVAEMPVGKGSVTEMAHIMCNVGPWSHGLPITAAGWEGDRYRK